MPCGSPLITIRMLSSITDSELSCSSSLSASDPEYLRPWCLENDTSPQNHVSTRSHQDDETRRILLAFENKKKTLSYRRRDAYSLFKPERNVRTNQLHLTMDDDDSD